MDGILAIIVETRDGVETPKYPIRMINGKPSISYIIETANSSVYIGDVVISASTSEIEIIAKQSNVRYIKQQANDEDENFNINALIANIADEYNAEYIVLLNPYSPMLQLDSLNRAIKECIHHNLDSLISAVVPGNKAWVQNVSETVSVETAQRDSMLTPPIFLETSTFVISKRSAITPHSLIGAKMDFFEISSAEALVADSLENTRIIEPFLAKERVAMLVAGNSKSGFEHIHSAVKFADECFDSLEIYCDLQKTERWVLKSSPVHLIPVDGIGDFIHRIKKKHYDIIINYFSPSVAEYMKTIKTCLPNARIINFDDDGEGAFYADLVINPLHQESSFPHMKSGCKYYIASDLQLAMQPVKINDKVKRVFVYFGWDDPQNYTERILNIVSKSKYNQLEFALIVGCANSHTAALEGFNKRNINVIQHTNEITQIMAGCDIGISARDSTCFDLALLGIPSISIANNPQEEKNTYISRDNGFSYLGFNPSDDIIMAFLDMYVQMSPFERQKRQDLLLSHDSRNGRKRVMNLINSL